MKLVRDSFRALDHHIGFSFGKKKKMQSQTSGDFYSAFAVFCENVFKKLPTVVIEGQKTNFERLRATDAGLVPFKKWQILKLDKKHAKRLPTRFSEMYAGNISTSQRASSGTLQT
jgi:hypothetical protein